MVQSKTQDQDDIDSPTHQSSNRRRRRRRARARARESSEESAISMSVGRVSDGVYELEKIVDARVAYRVCTPFVRSSGLDYKVEWKGWPEKYNSWEVESHINGEDVVGKYWRNVVKQSQLKNQMKSSQVLEVKPIKDSMARIRAATKLL